MVQSDVQIAFCTTNTKFQKMVSNNRFVVLEANRWLSKHRESYEVECNDMLSQEFGKNQHWMVHSEDDNNSTTRSLLLFALDCTTNSLGPVVGHVQMTAKTESKPVSPGQASRMLKAGVSEMAVRQMVKSAHDGMELEDFLQQAPPGHEEDDNERDSYSSALIGALVVQPLLRGLGLGRVLAMMAAAWSARVWNVQTLRAFALTERLLEWYRRLGATVEREFLPRRPKGMREITFQVQKFLSASWETNLDHIQQQAMPLSIAFLECEQDLVDTLRTTSSSTNTTN